MTDGFWNPSILPVILLVFARNVIEKEESSILVQFTWGCIDEQLKLPSIGTSEKISE